MYIMMLCNDFCCHKSTRMHLSCVNFSINSCMGVYFDSYEELNCM